MRTTYTAHLIFRDFNDIIVYITIQRQKLPQNSPCTSQYECYHIIHRREEAESRNMNSTANEQCQRLVSNE